MGSRHRLCLLVVTFWLAGGLSVDAAPTAEIGLDRQESAIWLATTVNEPRDGRLRVKVFSPPVDGTRTLWQVCSFAVVDTGPYRCGLDRRAVEREPGRWVARALLDDDPIGRREFWIR